MNLILIMLSFAIALYSLISTRRYSYWNREIPSFIEAIMHIGTLVSIVIYTTYTGNYLIDTFNPKVRNEPMLLILPFVVLLITSCIFIYLIDKGHFVRPSKYECIIIDFVDNNKLLKSPIALKILGAIATIAFIASVFGFLAQGVDIFDKSGETTKEIQILGVSKMPSYIDSNGNTIEPEYSILYKMVGEDTYTTLNNDNCDINKLEDYYQEFKHNIESIYKATMSVSQSRKNPDVKSYDLIDIIYEKEAK